MMLYDALEEILPFPDCAKNTICNCFSGLQIHNNVTQGLQIPADRKRVDNSEQGLVISLLNTD